eukprot:6891660-Alexandrium_andersonii.AAC.1
MLKDAIAKPSEAEQAEGIPWLTLRHFGSRSISRLSSLVPAYGRFDHSAHLSSAYPFTGNGPGHDVQQAAAKAR